MKSVSLCVFLFPFFCWAFPGGFAQSGFGIEQTQKASVNGRDVLETRSLTNAYKYFVVLEITKPGDFGYCAGAIIDSRFILTAAHCIYNATKIDVYYYSYDAGNKLRHSKGITQAHKAFPNWNNGVDPNKPVLPADKDKVSDFGLVMVSGIPSTAEPIELAPENTDAVGGRVAYGFGMDNRLPKPYYSGDRITGISLHSFQPLGPAGRSWNFIAGIPKIFSRKRTGSCAGDSGGPVVVIENSQVKLLGTHSGGTLVDDTPTDLDDPRSEKMSEKMCSDVAYFTNISMRLPDINALKDALLALPQGSLRKK